MKEFLFAEMRNFAHRSLSVDHISPRQNPKPKGYYKFAMGNVNIALGVDGRLFGRPSNLGANASLPNNAHSEGLQNNCANESRYINHIVVIVNPTITTVLKD